jgi:uncharacterized protein
MPRESRCVFDTNVIVSAVLFENSKPGQAIRLALRRGAVVMSLETLRELHEVLAREKFARYVSPERREDFLLALVERVELVDPVEAVHVCRDPADDKFLELAASARADYLVTGDQDLLSLNPFRGTAILTADALLDVLGLSD